ncbi:alpha/beta fold hydrolase [Nocardioides aurantiacus]|uniref:Pimeloyl-ACP methyl ester carboxylesterase n=1 Tax=Nocardioides aurantiacus TaxID=86796 RepID=A0A3N2CR21_9ACTN|nr:alpha/beta hydrolase [Nocardioides aurantiacus]ROR89951.1 pimeloyl-ACP methyl ester carboxylesterase [Nocardioides aurantiacus]
MARHRPRPLTIAPSADEGLALRYYPVKSADGTVLQAWTNDVEGPTVLLCNGLGTNPYAWPSLLDPGCGVRVVSWNHRGTGGSERPTDRDRVGIDAFAEDALAVMDDAGIDACVLMGWSMGVNTMFEVAVRHPERVTGLYAVGGVPGDTFASMGAPLRIPRPLRKPLTVNLTRVAMTVGRAVTPWSSQLAIGPRALHLLTHSGFMAPVADEGLSRRAVREFLTTPVEWYMHLAYHSSQHARVSLRRISVPTSFLAGRTDVLASAHDMRTAAERIPGATYRLLRATHFLPMERPSEVHAELLALLARIPDSPRTQDGTVS